MHESSVMKKLLEAIEGVVRECRAERAIRVNVYVGDLCGFSDAHLKAHFEWAAEGTVAEGAELCIEHSENPFALMQSVVLKDIEVEYS